MNGGINVEQFISKTSFSDEELYSLMFQAERSGAFVAHIRGKYCKTVEEFFREASSALRFPYYFGNNWAAFDECVTDLEWLSFSSLMIAVDDWDTIFEKEFRKSACRELLEKNLRIAAEYWQGQNIPVVIYLNSKNA